MSPSAVRGSAIAYDQPIAPLIPADTATPTVESTAATALPRAPAAQHRLIRVAASATPASCEIKSLIAHWAATLRPPPVTFPTWLAADARPLHLASYPRRHPSRSRPRLTFVDTTPMSPQGPAARQDLAVRSTRIGLSEPPLRTGDCSSAETAGIKSACCVAPVDLGVKWRDRCPAEPQLRPELVTWGTRPARSGCSALVIVADPVVADPFGSSRNPAARSTASACGRDLVMNPAPVPARQGRRPGRQAFPTPSSFSRVIGSSNTKP